MFYSIVIK